MQIPFCVICGTNYRKSGSLYCSQCEIYKDYEKEVWYKEIIAMQQRQYRIDKREGFPLLMDHEATLDGSPVKDSGHFVRNVGRPRSFTEQDKEKVISIFMEYHGNIPVRRLTAVLNNLGMKISRETVRKYINSVKHFIQ